MDIKVIAEVLFFLVLVLLVAKPMGNFMYLVFDGKRNFLSPVMEPVEKFIYKVSGVKDSGQGWAEYALSVIAFNILGLIVLFAIMMFQQFLPLNPQGLKAPEWRLALNTAISFVTNTNWQAYTPESTVSYFTQMVGLAVQNFVSAASGIAVSLALIRGLVRKQTRDLGNFWVDLTRSCLYVLLPIAIISALFLVWQGVPQNFSGYTHAVTVEGAKQVIGQGTVASQEAIKELGTNGGGFFNANSAHPYENPTPLSNILEMLLIILIPAGLIFTFGKFVHDIKQGRALFYAVFITFAIFIAGAVYYETAPNPAFAKGAAVTNISAKDIPSEGKETRFFGGASPIFSVVTTVTSCGAVNNMHDSNMPMTGFIELFDMQLGELIFGGVGSGMYTLLLFALITVFLAGLMIGRTPEYLGKKIGPTEIKLTAAASLFSGIMMLVVSAIAVYVPGAAASTMGSVPHGFSQMLYAATSTAGNNGSAFAGFNANTGFWNLILGLNMFVARFVPMILVLMLAGRFAAKNVTPVSVGTLPTNDALFAFMLVMVILLVGGLTFLPALSMGPIADHMALFSGIR
jgi:K+-transporting ATPase ATPase A chain